MHVCQLQGIHQIGHVRKGQGTMRFHTTAQVLGKSAGEVPETPVVQGSMLLCMSSRSVFMPESLLFFQTAAYMICWAYQISWEAGVLQKLLTLGCCPTTCTVRHLMSTESIICGPTP